MPAVTHRDRSSRVQHVSPQTGLLYQLLIELERMGAPPVLLKTSFNGPARPWSTRRRTRSPKRRGLGCATS
ncbi:MAG: hypothetical protein JOY83_06105 [Alphaproteobacteria bacterium]|nr:hypothetical protein [Alphaproteobacteria bacterium]